MLTTLAQVSHVRWYFGLTPKGPHVPPFKLGLSPIVTCTCSGLVDDIPLLILPHLGVNPQMPARTTLKPLEKAARQPEDLVR